MALLVGAVVFMVWVYLAALVLLIGAEVMIQIPTTTDGSNRAKVAKVPEPDC